MAMRWGDEKCLELSRNLHNNGAPGARASELESISRVAVDRDRHGYTSQVSLPTWMAKTFATLDGGKGNDSSQFFNSSGKLVYLERRSLLVELSWLNMSCRKLLHVYTRFIYDHVCEFFTVDTILYRTCIRTTCWNKKTSFVSQKLFVTFVRFRGISEKFDIWRRRSCALRLTFMHHKCVKCKKHMW